MISSGKQTKLCLFFCFCLKSDCVSLPCMQYWTKLNSKDWSCLSSELVSVWTKHKECHSIYKVCWALFWETDNWFSMPSDGCIRVQRFTEVMQLRSYWLRPPKLVWGQSTVVVVSGCSTFDLTDSGHQNWYGSSRQWWLYQGAAPSILLIQATKTGMGAVDSGGCVRVQHLRSYWFRPPKLVWGQSTVVVVSGCSTFDLTDSGHQNWYGGSRQWWLYQGAAPSILLIEATKTGMGAVDSGGCIRVQHLRSYWFRPPKLVWGQSTVVVVSGCSTFDLTDSGHQNWYGSSRQWWLYQGAAPSILLIQATKTGMGAVDSGGCIRVQHLRSYWLRPPKLVWEQSTVVVVSGCSTFDLTDSGHQNWYGSSRQWWLYQGAAPSILLIEATKTGMGAVDSGGCIRVQHLRSYWLRPPKLVWEQSTVVVVSGCSTFDLTDSGHQNWYGSSRQWWLYQGAAPSILLIQATKTGMGAVDSGGCIRVQHLRSYWFRPPKLVWGQSTVVVVSGCSTFDLTESGH